MPTSRVFFTKTQVALFTKKQGKGCVFEQKTRHFCDFAKKSVHFGHLMYEFFLAYRPGYNKSATITSAR